MYIYVEKVFCNILNNCILWLNRIPAINSNKGILITNINIRIYYDLCKEKGKKMGLKSLILRPIVKFGVVFSGAAGGRTPVQTRNPYAFYMLSQTLIFVNWPT